MSHLFWVNVTNLGDSALLLSLSLALFGLLWWGHSLRAALLWATAFAGCVAALVLLKLTFIACGKYWGLKVHSPSGHTGLSLMVYGAITTVLVKQAATQARLYIVLATMLLVLLIAYSRVVLGAHSPHEVLIGGGTAMVVLGLFAKAYLNWSFRVLPVRVLLSTLATCMVLMYGVHAPAEAAVRQAAGALKHHFEICV